MASLDQQINFEHWANVQSLKAITALSVPISEALSILAHVVAISNFWAARVDGTSERFDPWPSTSASELEAGLQQVRDRWIKLVADYAFDAEVRYRSSKGDDCSNRFDEVLQEVLLHGAHHRGQIAITLRLKGFEPPVSTDFIPATKLFSLRRFL